MNEDEKLINNNDLKWSYDDTKTVKVFTVKKYDVVKYDVFEHTVSKFIISKKKNKIKYTMLYCNGSEYIKSSIEMVEDFIKKYGNVISEDRKDIQLPI